MDPASRQDQNADDEVDVPDMDSLSHKGGKVLLT